MSLHDIANQYTTLLNGTALYVQIFIILVLTGIVHILETLVYRRLKAKFVKTINDWDEAILEALHKPLGFLIWFMGISIAIDIIRIEENGAAIYTFIGPLREVVVIGIIAWILVRLVKQVTDSLSKPSSKRKARDKTTVGAISQVLRAAIIITAILIILQTLGYNLTGVLTIGSVGTLILGFAAKDLLANFFGGLMVYFDRPFNIGDWIRSPDKNIEGTVEKIGWRLTRIRTFDKRPLYVPNSFFSTISVENPSRMQNRRIKTLIGLRYDDATKAAVIIADVEKMLRAHPEIDANQTLMVCLVEFGASSLNFMVYTFTKTTMWVKFQMIQQDVFLKIIDIIDSHGAECAFPTTTLHVPEGLEITNKEPLS